MSYLSKQPNYHCNDLKAEGIPCPRWEGIDVLLRQCHAYVGIHCTVGLVVTAEHLCSICRVILWDLSKQAELQSYKGTAWRAIDTYYYSLTAIR